jgi:hypothetical protein
MEGLESKARELISLRYFLECHAPCGTPKNIGFYLIHDPRLET